MSALFVLVVACAGYWWTGTPAALTGQVPVAASSGGAGAADEAAQVAEFTRMVEQLRERMDKEPATEGLMMLGRSYLMLSKPVEAVAAYERALKMEPRNVNLLVDMADALAVKNGNSLAGEPMKMVDQALRIAPDHLKGLMLAGSAAYERKALPEAVKYWQRMVAVGPADHPLVQQAGQAVAQVQRMVDQASPSGGATAGVDKAVAPAARITGTVSLADAVKAGASPEDAVFVFARPTEGSRMPLAILRRQVKDLPLTFTLDDSLAMSPAARLSSVSQVIVGARISKSGNAMPQAGDLEVLSEPVAVGAQNIKLEISRAVR